MARTPKPDVIDNFRHSDALKLQFLALIASECTEVLDSLLADVLEGSTSLAKWANRYGIAGTWIEHAARETLIHWRDFPGDRGTWSPSPLQATARSVGEETIHFGLALDPWDPFDLPRRENFEQVRRVAHRELDAALDEYLARSLSLGRIQKIRAPSDLAKKMECSAIYLFRGHSYESIAMAMRADKTRVRAWIKEVLGLLDLKTRTAGRPRNVVPNSIK